jgi:hypothetical protein
MMVKFVLKMKYEYKHKHKHNKVAEPILELERLKHTVVAKLIIERRTGQNTSTI